MPPEALKTADVKGILQKQPWMKQLRDMHGEERDGLLLSMFESEGDMLEQMRNDAGWERLVIAELTKDFTSFTQARDMWSLGISLFVMMLRRTSLHATLHFDFGTGEESSRYNVNMQGEEAIPTSGRAMDVFSSAKEYANRAACNIRAAFLPIPGRSDRVPPNAGISGAPWLSVLFEKASAGSKMDLGDRRLWQPIIAVIDGVTRWHPASRWTADKCLHSLNAQSSAPSATATPRRPGHGGPSERHGGASAHRSIAQGHGGAAVVGQSGAAHNSGQCGSLPQTPPHSVEGQSGSGRGQDGARAAAGDLS